jgi:phage gp29-like protein
MLPHLASLTPQYVESILRQAMAGNHQQAWELFDLMLDTDPEIAACTQEFTESVLRKKIIIEPYHDENEEPTPSAMERMKVVSAALRRMRPAPDCDENNFRETLRDIVAARWFGTSILEIDFYTDEDENGVSGPYRINVKDVGPIIAPRTTFWVHPVCYAWSQEGRLGLRLPETDARRTISRRDYQRADKRGGFGSSKFNVQGSKFGAAYGAPTLDHNFTAQQLTRFTPNKFLISKFKAKSGGALAGSVLRPLAWWWVASNFCGDWLLNLAQLFGIPFRKAKHGTGASDVTKEEIRQMLQNCGSAGYILLPDDAEVEFIQSGSGAQQSPQAFLFEFADRQKRKVILGQTMSGASGTTGKGGGQAFGTVEADVKGNKIDSAGEDACAVINEQLIPAILNVNYGDDDEAPAIRLLDEEEGGLEDANRDMALASGGLEIGKDFLRKKYGLPKPRQEEETIGGATTLKEEAK